MPYRWPAPGEKQWIMSTDDEPGWTGRRPPGQARSPGQTAEVDDALTRGAPEIEYKRRHCFEANFAAGLLGVDFAGEGMPAARLIKCEIVRFAEQQRERDGFVCAHVVVPPTGRAAALPGAATVGGGQTPADAADLKLASIPGDG